MNGEAVEGGAAGAPVGTWLEQTAGRGADGAALPAVAPSRPRATYALSGVVAGGACLVFLAAVFIIAAARAGAVPFGYSGAARSLFLVAALLAALGLVAAAGIAVAAARARRPRSGPVRTQTVVTGGSTRAGNGRRVLLFGLAAVLVAGSILLFLAFGWFGLGMFGRLSSLAALVIAVMGAVVAGVVVVIAVLPGRATSLRTRTFGVIVIVVLIPSLCLAAFGAWAYMRSWNVATSISRDQANYRAEELGREVRSVQRQPARFAPADRAMLADAIARMYAWSHPEGAQLATLSEIRQTSTLPVWAIRGLQRRGFAIGDERGATDLSQADIVAWRVGPEVVRYFVPTSGGYELSTPPFPLDRLLWIGVSGVALIIVLGLLGAWLLSRSVVRPVRRLAEASGRLAEGEAGVTVTPQGPKELRELAVSFNDMNAKLTRAQETEQAFLLSVSHELKTPLTSIRGYAEGIGDGTIESDEGAAVITAESTRLERLVGDLLESGRMRKSAFTVRREAVDLVAVAEDVARRYEATARDAGLTLLLNTEAGGRATADHDRVLQVVSNLVENAIRCTPAPGSVTISTSPCAITVADTGRGLTSDDLPRAFERFYLYSRYGTDRPVGTGLGLAIVKELTEAMGGVVSVSSAVGVGTAFTVSLPGSAVSPGVAASAGPGAAPAMAAPAVTEPVAPPPPAAATATGDTAVTAPPSPDAAAVAESAPPAESSVTTPKDDVS
ncbi:MAG TPA: HAMP domain-containing sensor histidine kinase [Thermoleophilia bacterium]|nr:HAMP domain-containing sensor histidine kinase [Thermoleophilia bacterium]